MNDFFPFSDFRLNAVMLVALFDSIENIDSAKDHNACYVRAYFLLWWRVSNGDILFQLA